MKKKEKGGKGEKIKKNGKRGRKKSVIFSNSPVDKRSWSTEQWKKRGRSKVHLRVQKNKHIMVSSLSMKSVGEKRFESHKKKLQPNLKWKKQVMFNFWYWWVWGSDIDQVWLLIGRWWVLTLWNGAQVNVSSFVFHRHRHHKRRVHRLLFRLCHLQWHHSEVSECTTLWPCECVMSRPVTLEGASLSVFCGGTPYECSTSEITVTNWLRRDISSSWLMQSGGGRDLPTRALLRTLRTLVWFFFAAFPTSTSCSSRTCSTMFRIFPRASFPRVSMMEANTTWQVKGQTQAHKLTLHLQRHQYQTLSNTVTPL